MRTTKSYQKYIKLYGEHFNKKLCDFAVSLMETDKGRITPFTKQEIEQKLTNSGIKLEYNKLHDFVYVANMGKADFFGDCIPNDDYHICMYIKKVIDDPDGYDGQVFNRWLSDMEGMQISIDWEDML